MRIHISILVATFNGERFLPDLLLSLAQQTYQPFEIVFCDDGSTDQTISILEEFTRTCPINSKVVSNQKNKGHARNFLEGLNLCKGDYVAFCDQDDVWKNNKLERLATRIKPDLTPSMVFSDCELVDSELNSLHQTAIGYAGITPREKKEIFEGKLFNILVKRPLIPGMCMLIKRSQAMQNLHMAEDLMHDYALSAGFSIGGDYSFLDECLVLYRQHSSNSIGMPLSKRNRKKIRPPIWDVSYARELNSDLKGNLLLYLYLIGFKTASGITDENLAELLFSKINFKSFRRKRRTKLKSLLFESFQNKHIHIYKKDSAKNFLKDFRCFFRLKINRVLIGKEGMSRHRPKPLYNKDKKIALVFSAKSACSFGAKWFFYQTGLHDACNSYNPWPHTFRTEIFNPYLNHEIDDNFFDSTVVFLVRNPFKRAVSSYLHFVKFNIELDSISSYLHRNCHESSFTFREFVGFLKTIDLKRCDEHAKIQAPDFIFFNSFKNKNIVRVENMLNDFAELEKSNNLKKSPHDLFTNSLSSHRIMINSNLSETCSDRRFFKSDLESNNIPNYNFFLSDDLMRDIFTLYRVDFETFEYPYKL